MAGVHFPVDSVAGALLGLTVGQYLVDIASRSGRFKGYEFKGEAFPESEDFDWNKIYDVQADPPAIKTDTPYVGQLDQPSFAGINQSSPLHWLWCRAKSEWN